MKLLRLTKWPGSSVQALPSCSVAHGWWLAFMQLIRRKAVREKACIKAGCYFRSVWWEKYWHCRRACPPAPPARAWREAGASRAAVLFPPISRACKPRTLSVRRNIPAVEPLVLPHHARVPALGCQLVRLDLAAWIPPVSHPSGLTTAPWTQVSPHALLSTASLEEPLYLTSLQLSLFCAVGTASAGELCLPGAWGPSVHPGLAMERSWARASLCERMHRVPALTEI